MAAKNKGKPDPRLAFVSAEAFLEVCKVLVAALEAGNTRILSLAMATNAAFSLEMYLKCLLLLETGNALWGHDLYDLFRTLSESTRSELTRAHEEFVESNPALMERLSQEGLATDLEQLLKRGRSAFSDFRYAHEQIPLNTDFALNGLTYCVRERILMLRPEWKSALQDIADAELQRLSQNLQ
jgi:HEPN domain-containing protein